MACEIPLLHLQLKWAVLGFHLGHKLWGWIQLRIRSNFCGLLEVHGRYHKAHGFCLVGPNVVLLRSFSVKQERVGFNRLAETSVKKVELHGFFDSSTEGFLNEASFVKSDCLLGCFFLISITAGAWIPSSSAGASAAFLRQELLGGERHHESGKLSWVLQGRCVDGERSMDF